MLREQKRLVVYRSATPAAPVLPLRVRSVGRYELDRDWVEEPRQKWFVELFWGISGRGEFYTGEDWVTLEPEWIFLYRPGDHHWLRVLTESWRYCWVTFDHASAEEWINGFGLHERTCRAGACPEALFLEIAEALHRSTVQGEIHAANIGHQILAEASVQVTHPPADSIASRAKAIIDKHFMDPQFGVAALSDELAIHRSTLFRQFAAAHGLNPSSYLQNLRLQRGLNLLRETVTPIQEIALTAGFTDPNYFARAVRDATGMSPRALRRS
ncbi:helix-turn-helix transcriptional regulator [Cerasicoccus arenae]|nr:AraC family transcriptional regulator [Cerasicoccus arenae]MBK1859560.1 helix-turn-helix transcriptional regulator [Cerasicoccus arenae]